MKSYQPGIIEMAFEALGYTSKSAESLSLDITSKNNNSASEASAYYDGSQGISQGGYSGGQKTFNGFSGSGRNVVINHAVTRRNARATMQDSAGARSIVERFSNLGAGSGIRLEASPVASLLGISEEAARIWSNDVEQKFHLYCSDKKQSRDEEMSLYQYQRLYMLEQQRDNDMFTRLHYTDDPGLQSGLQFQGIDPTQIRGDAYTFSGFPNGTIKDGIIRDERGRAVAYNIFVKKKDGTFKEVTIPSHTSDRGRVNMLHGYMPEYVGQARGFSRLAHAVEDFQKLTDFDVAHIQKAINEASIWIATQNKQQTPSNLFEGMAGRKAGPGGISLDELPVIPTSSDLNRIKDFCDVSQAPLLEPGLGIFNAEQGDEIKLFDGKTPNSQYEAFVTAFTSFLSASMGMPIEILLMKFNQNYSASRATLLLFWQELEMWREEMATDLLHPIYEMWLSEEIFGGRIQAPGWSDPRLRAAWLNNSWIGSPVPDIDPQRTAKARGMNISLGASSGDREARGLNGTSFDANRRKITEEFGAPPPPPWIKNPGEAGSASGSGDASAYQDFLSDIEDMLETKFEDMMEAR